MKANNLQPLCFGFLICALTSIPVAASSHLIQIEQVIGGVESDATAQAIQLRMRGSLENFVTGSRIVAWDSAGQNPITIIVFPANVPNGGANVRILIASAGFTSHTDPPASLDFVMTNLIPASYLAAGSLTFEGSLGAINWRLSWGGAAYTGLTTGSTSNDIDGNFGPPWPGALPSADLRALQFQGAATALSSTNAADYALTTGDAVFTNNAGIAFALVPPPAGACCVELRGECVDGLEQAACEAAGGSFGGRGTTCATSTAPCESALSVGLQTVASGLVSPVLATHAGDGSGRLFIVDQVGQIWIVNNGATLAAPFLDVTTKIIVPDLGFDERGLLGLAFHPNYAVNGRFFVRYSAPRVGTAGDPCFGTPRGCHTAILAEYTVSAGDPNVADVNSERILFTVDEPEFNHDAGNILFGPDGLLYFSLGDGGGRDDGLSATPVAHGPIGNGQNINTVLGSVLRIDVDSAPDAGLSYAIPADNPFVGVAGADEIYAYGFRNPYRFSFDDGPGGDGSLYLGDVGQDLVEEVDIVVKGGNYGWVIREGTRCFDPMDPFTPPAMCPTVGTILGDPLIDPVMVYIQPVACTVDADCAALSVGCGSNGLCLDEGGISVIAGNVYRGSRLPGMKGKFVFGDFSDSFGVPGGRLYYFDTTGPDVFKRRQFTLTVDGGVLGRFVKGMGRDEDGELYVCATDLLGPSGTSGVVLKIVPPTARASGVSPRYLAITLPDGSAPVGITVTPDCAGGVPQQVSAPTGSDNIALLTGGSPGAFLLPSQWGKTVHVTGIDIVPGTTYKVQVDNGVANAPDLSAAVTATTSGWGDVAGQFSNGIWPAPDGSVDVFSDVIAILQAFGRRSTAPALFRADLIGVGATGIDCLPDQVIDIQDIVGAVGGFSGVPFETRTGCGLPCP